MTAITLPPNEGKVVSLPGGHRVRFVHQQAGAAYTLVEWCAALDVRRALSARYDIEVVGRPRQASGQAA